MSSTSELSLILCVLALSLGLLSLQNLLVTAQRQPEGESCDNDNGVCKQLQYCGDIVKRLSTIDLDETIFCNRDSGIVCCPKYLPELDYRAGYNSEEPQSDAEKACLEFSRLAPSSCPQPLIIGGKRAQAREFPSIALLGTKDKRSNKVQWVCGGTLISERYVITAAHCWQRDIDSVRLGELDYSTNSDPTQTQDFNVLNAIVHPRFTFDRYNDIALIELDHDVVFNEYVLPACLPSKIDTYTGFTAVGWGQTEQGIGSPHLLKVQLELFSDKECNISAPVIDELEKGLHQRTQICAGSHISNADTCKGDSGGPLYVSHSRHNCMWKLAAITSFGYIKCGTTGIPSVNTKVNLYLDWIEGIVWDAKKQL